MLDQNNLSRFMGKNVSNVLFLMERMGLVRGSDLILEVMTPIDLYNKLTKSDLGIDKEYYKSILSIDPFTVNNKVGKLASWFFSLPDVKTNIENYSSDVLKEYFEKYYELAKRKKLSDELNQIQNFKNINSFISELNGINLEDNKSNREIEKEIKENEVEVFYDDGNWLVLTPLTERASCYYGKGTKWCTASRDADDNHFYKYNQQGPLYIFIDLNDKDYKYQLHLQEGEFKDSANNDVNLFDLDLPMALLEKFPENNMFMIDNGVIALHDNIEGSVKIMNSNYEYYSVRKSGYPLLYDEGLNNKVDYYYYIDWLSDDVKEFIEDKIDNEDIKAIPEIHAIINYINNFISKYYPENKEMLIVQLDDATWTLYDSDNEEINDGFIFNTLDKDILNYILRISEDITEQIDNLYLNDSYGEYYFVDGNNKLYMYDREDALYNFNTNGVDMTIVKKEDVPNKFTNFIDSNE